MGTFPRCFSGRGVWEGVTVNDVTRGWDPFRKYGCKPPHGRQERTPSPVSVPDLLPSRVSPWGWDWCPVPCVTVEVGLVPLHVGRRGAREDSASRVEDSSNT